MFAAFFYLLRQRGLDVSLNEWMTLLEGMEKGLHHSTLTGFYHLCRAVLVKSEAEFDRFDQVFLEFFRDVPYNGELPEELLNWLNHPSRGSAAAPLKSCAPQGFPDETLEDLLKLLEERLQEQTEEHNGGNYWVGTQGRSPCGNSGWHPNGIRIGGAGHAPHRHDGGRGAEVPGLPEGQHAGYPPVPDGLPAPCASSPPRRSSSEKELDVDGTIHDTCDNAGHAGGALPQPPEKHRQGAAADGLRRLHGVLRRALQHACSRPPPSPTISRSCTPTISTTASTPSVYLRSPACGGTSAVPTEWLLQNFDSTYKVILVGDAAMNPYELREKQYDWQDQRYGPSGLELAGAAEKALPLSHLAQPGAHARRAGLLDPDPLAAGAALPHVSSSPPRGWRRA